MINAIGNFIGQNTNFSNSDSSDTTANGEQVFWITGSDSNYGDTSSSTVKGPTTPSGTCYLWNGTGLTELTTADINKATVNGGTPWKQFALDYVSNNPGKKVVFVHDASGGSDLYLSGDTNNWYETEGTLRAASEANVDACLSFLGLTKPKGIFCDAGINDEIASKTAANYSIGLDSFITFLTNKFSDVPILWAVIGHDGTTNNSLLLRQYRNVIVQKARNTTNMWVSCFFGTAEPWGMGNGLHPVTNNDFYNHVGRAHARWYANPSYSKFARSIICSHYSDLNTTRKDEIESEISGYGNNYFGYEYIFWEAPGLNSNDSFLDFTFLTSPLDSSTVYNTSGYRTSSGLSGSFLRTRYLPNSMSIRATADDEFHGICLRTVRSDATALRAAFGATVSTNIFTVGHTTTGVIYRCNDGTLTAYGTQANLQNDSEYIGARAANTGTDAKRLYYNGTMVHSATTTRVGQPSQNICTGGNNVSGTVGQLMDQDWRCRFGGAHSMVNHGNDYSIRRAKILNW